MTWQTTNTDGDGWGIFAKQFTHDGVAGNVFQVNTHTANDQRFAAVAGLSNGFIIVWESEAQASDNFYGIYGQRFDANAVKVGTEFFKLLDS